MILGGLQLDCHENNSDKLINSDLQVVEDVPFQWVCPVEYELYP